MKLRYVLVLAAAVLGAALLTGVGRPERARGEAAVAERTITVGGTGLVSAVPNRASFSFGVETQAKTASAALTDNGAAMRKVIAAVKAAGVAPADIQTQQVSLSPRYSDDGSTILGYTASNSVSVSVKNLEKAGALVDAAVAAGANDVSGPSLFRADQQALVRQALKNAVTDAREKAQALAEAAGVTLGEVQTIAVDETPQPMASDAKAAAPEASTPIEPGMESLQATVTVTFAVT